MTGDIGITFCLGWFLGSLAMWAYFFFAGLIRSKEEYYAARKEKENRHKD